MSSAATTAIIASLARRVIWDKRIVM
jgi:hypothetical protein